MFGTDRTMASMSPHLGRVLLEYGRWHWVTPVVVGGGLGGGGLRCAPWGLARGSFGSWCLLVRFGSACCLCVCSCSCSCLLLGLVWVSHLCIIYLCYVHAWNLLTAVNSGTCITGVIVSTAQGLSSDTLPRTLLLSFLIKFYSEYINFSPRSATS